jgi:hypothetical protein
MTASQTPALHPKAQAPLCFSYRKSPFFFIFPLSLALGSFWTLQHAGNATPAWIYIWTPWTLMGIAGLWLLSMMVSQEYRFQKIESDGKTIHFATHQYKGILTWEEVASYWLSDQKWWVVLYFLFKDEQVAERLRLNRQEVRLNLAETFCHHFWGLPRFAFSRKLQLKEWPSPDGILRIQEEGSWNLMGYFRIFLFLFASAIVWNTPLRAGQVDSSLGVLLALVAFFFALGWYPLATSRQWGFLKVQEDGFLFFRESVYFKISWGVPYEVRPEGKGFRVEFEGDSVQWLHEKYQHYPIKWKYRTSSFLFSEEEWKRFQEAYPPKSREGA